MASLSVTIITKNCDNTIGVCLQSIRKLADEIIVVDSGSTDKTLEICKEFTDKVYCMDWPGFGPQKQRALDKASCDWVLSLDADEVITEELAQEIQSLIKVSKYDAYKIKRYLVFGGKVIRYCGGNPYCLRLFKRDKANFSADLVHERVIVDGTVGRLKHYFYHYSYRDIAHWMSKMNEYTSLTVDKKIENGKKSSIGKAVASAIFSFIKFYFIKGGFLDGKMGFVVSMNWAAGNYYKYLKLSIDKDFL